VNHILIGKRKERSAFCVYFSIHITIFSVFSRKWVIVFQNLYFAIEEHL
jgi:hypothetical protein